MRHVVRGDLAAPRLLFDALAGTIHHGLKTQRSCSVLPIIVPRVQAGIPEGPACTHIGVFRFLSLVFVCLVSLRSRADGGWALTEVWVPVVFGSVLLLPLFLSGPCVRPKLTLHKPCLSSSRLAENGAASTANNDGLCVRENGGDAEAAC